MKWNPDPAPEAYLFFAISLIALGFLIYSLVQMEELGIHYFHPRIWGEFLLFLFFGLLGLSYLIK